MAHSFPRQPRAWIYWALSTLSPSPQTKDIPDTSRVYLLCHSSPDIFQTSRRRCLAAAPPPFLPKTGLPFFGLLGSEPSLLFIDVHRAVTVLGLGVLLLRALGCMAECSSHGLVRFSCTPGWNLDESFGRGALSGFLLLESGEGLSLH